MAACRNPRQTAERPIQEPMQTLTPKPDVDSSAMRVGGDPYAYGSNRRHVDGRRPVLVLNDVTKTYPNGRDALRDVDLVVPEGDFVFLVGPSGAGKSTLMKLLIRDELATRALLDAGLRLDGFPGIVCWSRPDHPFERYLPISLALV